VQYVDTIMRQLCDQRRSRYFCLLVFHPKRNLSWVGLFHVTHLIAVRKYCYRRDRKQSSFGTIDRVKSVTSSDVLSIRSHFQQFNTDCCMRANARWVHAVRAEEKRKSKKKKNRLACRPDVIAWEVTTNYLSFQSRAGNTRRRCRSGFVSLFTGRIRND